MRGKSIAAEISYSTLRGMRDQGMSNSMIAQRLEISASTVARYLGPMTHEERSRIMRERDFLDHEVQAESYTGRVEPIKPVLPLANVRYDMRGNVGSYRIDAKAQRLDIQLNDVWVSISTEDLPCLIEELTLVKNTNERFASVIANSMPFEQ